MKLKQKAGNISFVPYLINDSRIYFLMKQTTDPDTSIKYSLLQGDRTPTDPSFFLLDQRDIIDIFMNIFLPNFKFNGTFLTEKEIHSSKVIGSGNYGVIISSDHLIIKILKLYNYDRFVKETQIDTNQELYKHSFEGKNVFTIKDTLSVLTFNYPHGHPNICSLYSIFTTHFDTLNEIVKKLGIDTSNIKEHYPFYSYTLNGNLVIDVPKVQQSDDVLTEYQNSDDLIFLIMEKGEGSVNQYIRHLISTNTDQLTMINICMQLFYDIYEGLKFINIEKHYLHTDIKNANIIKCNDNFKIIDFGGAIKMCSLPFVSGPALPPDSLYSGTNLVKRISSDLEYVIYNYFDLHCLGVLLQVFLHLIYSQKITWTDETGIERSKYEFSIVEKLNGNVRLLFSLNDVEILDYIFMIFNNKCNNSNGNKLLFLCNIILILSQLRMFPDDKETFKIINVINPECFTRIRNMNIPEEMLKKEEMFIQKRIDDKDIKTIYKFIDDEITETEPFV
jgi:serine/threonine protein kinase